MNPYQKLQDRKRKWTPVQTTAGAVKDGAEEASAKARILGWKEELAQKSDEE